MGSSSGQTVSPEWSARVNRVVDHIRADPRRDRSLPELAALAHSSPYHFHRIFTAVVGESPAAFTRRCRLERAGQLMMASPDRSLTSIAADAGFPGLSDFSRQFRQHYGMAPSSWDRTTRIDRLPAPLSPSGSPDLAGDRRFVPRPRIIRLPELRLAYVRARGVIGLDDLSPRYRQLLEWAAASGLDLGRQRLIGMCWDNYETTPLDRIHYDFALTVPPTVEPRGLVGCYTLPSLTAVAVHCRGGLTTIASAWDHLYERWFPATGAVPRHLPALKLFNRRPDEIGWDRWDVDCAIAITTPPE